MNKLSGFTLIELVIVLALLAILAAVAVPRFVNLADDARKATATAELGALRAAAQLYYASTAVAGNPDFRDTAAALLTNDLDQGVTQLVNGTSCPAGTGRYCWAYDSSDGGVSSVSGGEDWTP